MMTPRDRRGYGPRRPLRTAGVPGRGVGRTAGPVAVRRAGRRPAAGAVRGGVKSG
jgi:hypothetical protein